MRTFASCILTSSWGCMLSAKRTCVPTAGWESLLSAETREAVEGLDPQLFGFDRRNCPCAIPAQGKMAMKDHLFMATAVRPPLWHNKMQNVPDMKTLQAAMRARGAEGLNLTGFYERDRKGGACALYVQPQDDRLQISEYTSTEAEFGCLPWESKTAAVRDRSDEIFIFVCAHKARDARCGYCGPILVDLFEQKNAAMGQKVNIFPCSHFGGHVYAANLLVFTRHIGRAYGLFRPEHVEPLLEGLVSGNAEALTMLEDKVRGQLVLKTKVKASL
ncbi:hypothetical protein STCU_03049 [Strigomonas culicis]|uniref:Sucraseferredoxin-like family protein n=1 Tax=Strigomonas culicis TaxID=28005 RepID=S9UT30_9TRYP|nr:hypothetical protein STCU_03049 [Strigomonas culicis]|eukprot:EPY31974.1 hypothetical protein STCU_03049 [Strigomonas culicis]